MVGIAMLCQKGWLRLTWGEWGWEVTGGRFVALRIAGGFKRGETVLAAKDLRVKGIIATWRRKIGDRLAHTCTDRRRRCQKNSMKSNQITGNPPFRLIFFCWSDDVFLLQSSYLCGSTMCSTFFSRKSTKTWPIVAEVTQKPFPLRWWSRTSSAPSLVKVPPTLQGASLWPSHGGKMGGATTCAWDAADGNHPKIGREVMQTCGKCQEMRGRNALNFTELMFLRQTKVSKWGISQFSRRSSMFMAFRHSWNMLEQLLPKFETLSDVCLFNWFDHVWTINHWTMVCLRTKLQQVEGCQVINGVSMISLRYKIFSLSDLLSFLKFACYVCDVFNFFLG